MPRLEQVSDHVDVLRPDGTAVEFGLPCVKSFSATLFPILLAYLYWQQVGVFECLLAWGFAILTCGLVFMPAPILVLHGRLVVIMLDIFCAIVACLPGCGLPGRCNRGCYHRSWHNRPVDPGTLPNCSFQPCVMFLTNLLCCVSDR